MGPSSLLNFPHPMSSLHHRLAWIDIMSLYIISRVIFYKGWSLSLGTWVWCMLWARQRTSVGEAEWRLLEDYRYLGWVTSCWQGYCSPHRRLDYISESLDGAVTKSDPLFVLMEMVCCLTGRRQYRVVEKKKTLESDTYWFKSQFYHLGQVS